MLARSPGGIGFFFMIHLPLCLRNVCAYGFFLVLDGDEVELLLGSNLGAVDGSVFSAANCCLVVPRGKGGLYIYSLALVR